ncbi:unnamed protein product, partial [Strongylus vulgaris]
VYVRIRAGTFKFPKEHKQVICIGPGTGVAPFRSYLSWRNRRSDKAAKSLLFFGCRGKENDFYFEQEWDQMPNTRVYAAFSRDTDRKIYVQHLILDRADEVWEILGEQDEASEKIAAKQFFASSGGSLSSCFPSSGKHNGRSFPQLVIVGNVYGVEATMDRLLRGLAMGVRAGDP